jgi:hypothetical protein
VPLEPIELDSWAVTVDLGKSRPKRFFAEGSERAPLASARMFSVGLTESCEAEPFWI